MSNQTIKTLLWWTTPAWLNLLMYATGANAWWYHKTAEIFNRHPPTCGRTVDDAFWCCSEGKANCTGKSCTLTDCYPTKDPRK